MFLSIPLLLFLAYVISYFFLAAYIRSTVMPVYVSIFYTNGINGVFESGFNQLNTALAKTDIILKNSPASCYNGARNTGDSYYHHFSETIPCQRSEISNPFVLSNSRTEQVKQLIKQYGWSPKTPSNLIWYAAYGVNTVYGYKQSGKTYCRIGVTAAYTKTKQYNLVEECERDVSFFGGSKP